MCTSFQARFMWIYLCSLAAAAQAQETEISVYNRVEHKIDNWPFAIAIYKETTMRLRLGHIPYSHNCKWQYHLA